MHDERDDPHRRRAHSAAAQAECRRMARPGVFVALVLVAAVGLSGCNPLGLGKTVKYPAKSLSVFALHAGQCLNPPTKVVAEVADLSVTSCKAPHTEQVFATLPDHAGSNYPGPEKLQSFANAKCLQHFAAFVGVPYQQSSLFYTYLLPSVRSWSSGDRTITCIVTTTGAKLTDSVQGSKR